MQTSLLAKIELQSHATKRNISGTTLSKATKLKYTLLYKYILNQNLDMKAEIIDKKTGLKVSL